MGHDRDDHRLQPVEDRGDGGQMPPGGQDPGQQQQDQRAGQHEQRPGGDAAGQPVQPPARIGGELLGLGSGQQGAEIEPAQEGALVDPAQPVDQLGLHHRDLRGGTAEAEAAELQPETQRRPEGRRGGGAVGHAGARRPISGRRP